jgi:hypothetical protein
MLHVQVTELPKWSGIIFLLMAISTIGKRRTESNNKEVSYLLNYHRTHLFFSWSVACYLHAARKNTRCRPRAHLFFSWSVACRTNEVLRANFSDWIPYRATFFLLVRRTNKVPSLWTFSPPASSTSARSRALWPPHPPMPLPVRPPLPALACPAPSHPNLTFSAHAANGRLLHHHSFAGSWYSSFSGNFS